MGRPEQGNLNFDPEQNGDKKPVSKIDVNKGDDLNFDCEYCSDRPGGCAQCGWGKRKNNLEFDSEESIH